VVLQLLRILRSELNKFLIDYSAEVKGLSLAVAPELGSKSEEISGNRSRSQS